MPAQRHSNLIQFEWQAKETLPEDASVTTSARTSSTLRAHHHSGTHIAGQGMRVCGGVGTTLALCGVCRAEDSHVTRIMRDHRRK